MILQILWSYLKRLTPVLASKGKSSFIYAKSLKMNGNFRFSSTTNVEMETVRLDQSDLNEHEVMPNLTTVIFHMADNNIMPKYEQVSLSMLL